MFYVFDIEDFSRLGTSKQQLAAILQISRTTLYNYYQLAYEHLIDFGKEFPKLGDRRVCSHPLTQYQCWILIKIYEWVHVHHVSKDVVIEKINQDPSLLSKERFEQEINIKVNQEPKQCKSQFLLKPGY